jgi:YfiH family protein
MTLLPPLPEQPAGTPREEAGGSPLFAAGLVERPGVAARLPGLVAAFSVALPRQADAGLAALLRDLAAERWGRAARAVPLPLLLRQTHSPLVLGLQGAAEGSATEPSPAGDGVWAEAGRPRLLAVKTADCVPLLAVDAKAGRYAALHAGWRGTAAGILPNLLAAWRAKGGQPRDVHLELGPHIQGCCYEVQADCLAHFDLQHLREALRQEAGRTWLRLAAVLRSQALAAGVPAEQVRVSAHCTCCHRSTDGSTPYASYRRSTHAGEAFVATNVGLIGVLTAP